MNASMAGSSPYKRRPIFRDLLGVLVHPAYAHVQITTCTSVKSSRLWSGYLQSASLMIRILSLFLQGFFLYALAPTLPNRPRSPSEVPRHPGMNKAGTVMHHACTSPSMQPHTATHLFIIRANHIALSCGAAAKHSAWMCTPIRIA